MFFNRLYSLRKCRHILKQYYALFLKKGQKLPQAKHHQFEKTLKELDQAILNKNRENANDLVKKLEKFDGQELKKSSLEYSIELIFALLFALVVAIVVRQVWFELYEIPTGSMRPTFMEKDRLTVSKTTFGINVPLMTQHFYFDPKLVERTGVLIFSGDNIPLEDNMGNYFWIFPAYKRYIKRLIGKPGDSIYFYGGLLYGVDKEGKAIPELIDSPWMKRLDHVPMLQFEGEITNPNPSTLIFSQMHNPVGRIVANVFGELKGEVFNGFDWVKDKPNPEPHRAIQTYSDIYGMGNYALARLLTKDQLLNTPGLDANQLEKGVLYLELSHHPSLTYPAPLFYSTTQGVIPMLDPLKTVIPLQQRHLDALMDHLYTSRFIVKEGRAKLYDPSNFPFQPSNPSFPKVPDGTYEFYYGKLSRINWGGIRSEASKDNPLYSRDPENIQKLFNLGIQMINSYQPNPANPNQFPQRYAYFRNGDLYLMGAPIILKGDTTLTAFLEREEKRKENAPEKEPYTPFKDYGPPLNQDGSYNADMIRIFGVTVPEKHYLVLGDNYARSADSRVFGFVPETNIEGAPSLIIWPPAAIGPPAQKPYPFMNFPRAFIWGIAILAFLIWFFIHRRNMKRPLIK